MSPRKLSVIEQVYFLQQGRQMKEREKIKRNKKAIYIDLSHTQEEIQTKEDWQSPYEWKG